MGEPAVRLSVGDPPVTVKVRARDKWNWAGVHVEPGERYELKAEGTWTDLFIKTDPDGFTTDDVPRLTRGFMRRYEEMRRMPAARWLCLVGCVGEEGEPFVIGKEHDWAVEEHQSGVLLCYANDVGKAYWNNLGSVQLVIRRSQVFGGHT